MWPTAPARSKAAQYWSELAQRAVGAIAARSRGDADGTQALLADFPDADSRSYAFMMAAELSLTLLAQATGDSLEGTAQRLNLAIEAGLTGQDSDERRSR